MPRPDAVKIPAELVTGKLADGERKARVIDLAEDLLQIDPASTELAWARDQDGFHFVTREEDALLLFPHGHPRAGQSRYRWTKRDDDAEIGFLDGD